ncbi:hypothetical protein AAFF_G00123110 [Aldrovandia affinis]|uniref:PHD-type domain-containing protein n=1 Tax=Aldrovandia affinis TaxID=143900 RepID=A0AAD7RRZ6_9TELE|nr:hypothetical protein AAFF_G00123110 [Aldrovandia affinis]
MDPLSQGQLMDDGLPQSPSACGVPRVYDLSRRRRDSSVNPTPVASLPMVRASRYCGISGGGAELPENSSAYHSPLSAQQVRPDNAFSNTTVTLSYINRSHLHSTQASFPPKLHAVPSHTGSLSRRSPSRDSKGEVQTQWYDEAQTVSHGQCRGRWEQAFSGRRRRKEERRGGTQNGVSRGFWDLESCKRKPSKLRTVAFARAEQRQSRGEAAYQGTSRDLGSPVNEDYASPLEEPLSPAVSLLDEMEDALILPQTLHSPSAESSYAEEASTDVAGVNSVAFVDVTSSPEDSCSSDSDVIEVPVTSSLTRLPAGATRALRKSPEMEECPAKKKAWNHTVRKTEPRVSEERLNGNALGQERAVGRKKQLPLSRQGAARREAIVGNVTPFGSKLSSRTHSLEQRPEPKTVQSLPRGLRDSAHNSAVETALARDRDGPCADGKKTRHSTSGSEDGAFPNPPTAALRLRDCPRPPPPWMRTRWKRGGRTVPGPRAAHRKKPRKPLTGQNQRKSRAKQPSAPSRDSRGAAKGACGKKRKKRKRASQPCSFGPQEPEIKLKYATYRDEKRDARAIAFTPYVRLNRKHSTCTVINYLEEESSGLKKGRPWQTGAGLAPGTVPATSYLELGRLDAEGRRQREEACCLCGGPANAIDLGDLHGPYRPHAVQPGPRAPADQQGPKEEEEACSDSDSSYDGRDDKCGRGQAESVKPSRPSQGPKRDAALAAQCRWVRDEDSPLSPSAKGPSPGSEPSSQHNTPRIALDTSEFWLHEDCGVWSMGVFLVRGKLYGLEEAVRLAQETDCSACHGPGATLGCFFKGCPSKYHYRCAMQSDCVLNEDNFTMKCTKHKNKSLKGVSRLENSSAHSLGCGILISADNGSHVCS